MAEPVSETQRSILTTKIAGRVPVWVIALAGLVLAWLYAKWRATKQAAADAAGNGKADTADATGADSESEQVAPQFIIMNNLPQGAGAPPTPSTPVTTVEPSPVVTPPGTKPNPPTTTPTKPPATKPPAKKPPLKYVVKHGDTLAAIAKRYKTTAPKLFAYNTTSGVRPAATIKTLKERGPNLLYAGETILIPQ